MSQLNPYSFFQTPPQVPGTALRPHAYTQAGPDPADQGLLNQQRMARGQAPLSFFDQPGMLGQAQAFAPSGLAPAPAHAPTPGGRPPPQGGNMFAAEHAHAPVNMRMMGLPQVRPGKDQAFRS